ncbi:unnamed protein product [Paramecium pentaurelia]|uniref:Uncharacterized protein n=1 Tax=Paramecium pentaurelia TaxID=43138 RepID=A0A8S1VKJ8_9CILI|nr:unnamed protein product [Paramecium pentaurelia]
MKIKKENKKKSSTYSERTHQNMKNKKQQAKEKLKNTDLGKPRNLKNISFEKPNIWATKEGAIRILTFLMNQGRHFLLHPAGAKKSIINEENEQNIKEKQDLLNQINKLKPLYDLLENIHQTFLGFPQKQKKKERLIVFFFRNNCDIEPHYDKVSPLENLHFQQNLEEIKFQLDNVFYRELSDILKQLEGNELNIQDQIKLITQDLVNQTNNLDEISLANTIVKNLFIQLLIEQGNHNLQLLEMIVEKQNKTLLLQIFKEFINQNSFRITKFITELVQLIQGDDLNNSIECTFQQTNYDENCIIQQNWQYLENENSVYLSD